MRASASEGEGERADRNRPRHHEGQGGIPAAKEVEEAEHLCRVGHAREDQADAEHQPGYEGENQCHGVLLQMPSTWRAINTVRKPAAMKVPVATSEPGDSREMPQTPCPLVQPEP